MRLASEHQPDERTHPNIRSSTTQSPRRHHGNEKQNDGWGGGAQDLTCASFWLIHAQASTARPPVRANGVRSRETRGVPKDASRKRPCPEKARVATLSTRAPPCLSSSALESPPPPSVVGGQVARLRTPLYKMVDAGMSPRRTAQIPPPPPHLRLRRVLSPDPPPSLPAPTPRPAR